MAGAAVLLALAVLGLGAGGLFYNQGKEKQATWFLAGGGVLLLAALGLFFLRPSFSSVDERVKLPTDKSVVGNTAFAWTGENVCKVDLARSRLTVSQPNDIGLNWADGGCVNGETQYVASGTVWQRAIVPDEANYVTSSQFDPSTGMLRVQRWLPDIDTMEKARALLKDKPIKGCGSDSELLSRIAALQSDVTTLLPPQANERIVYHCQKGRLAPADPAE
jgi:hypothetical protein